MNKVAIVSCDNWKGKIKEDIYLNDALIKLGIISQIISWEDKDVDFEGYDALILRSVWGYQNKYKEFKEWLLEIQKEK